MADGTDADDNVVLLPGAEPAPAGEAGRAPAPAPASAPAPEVPKLPLPVHERKDKRALKESKSYADRDLDGEALVNDHDRMEKLRGHVHLAEKALLWVAVVLLASGMLVWAFHVLMPVSWGWLNADQMLTVQHLLTTVAVSGLVGGLARRVMSPPGKKAADNDC